VAENGSISPLNGTTQPVDSEEKAEIQPWIDYSGKTRTNMYKVEIDTI